MTKYKISLTYIPSKNKADVLKAVKKTTGLNSDDAMSFIHNLPKTIAFDITIDDCKVIQDMFKDLGCQTLTEQMKPHEKIEDRLTLKAQQNNLSIKHQNEKYKVYLTDISASAIKRNIKNYLLSLTGMSEYHVDKLMNSLSQPQLIAYDVNFERAEQIKQSLAILDATVTFEPIKEGEVKDLRQLYHLVRSNESEFINPKPKYCYRCRNELTTKNERELGYCSLCAVRKSNDKFYVIGGIVAIFLFICWIGSIIT